MGIVGDSLNIDFVISTGDNFYKDGLEGVDDPTFYESFVNIYTALSLQKIWYSGIVEFFFVDTTPFIEKYFTDPKEHTYDWNGVLPRELINVDSALVQSKARWKIVVGHHTIKTVGHHGNTQELEEQLLPILKALRGDIKSWNLEEVKFYHDGQGFMSVQITEMNVDVVFYDVLGKILHRWSISKELKAAT
ncbi:putative Acid phosphatase [Medicago truncatula]|uniref:Putative Acid phosphatase n=1 Tax=Medicago truncatula TaxID=3880 RepID=A0A396GUQ4_MEDTR|nr:putative Acid phosphatase [Medicago truncatula]